MNFFRRISGQLILIVMGTALPLIAVIGYILYGMSVNIETSAKRNITEVATRVAAEIEAIDESTRHLAAYLANRPRVQAMKASDCDPQIVELTRINPIYATIILADLQGKVVCWSNPSNSRAVSYADRKWFRDGLSGKFGWGEPVFGKAAKQWVTTLTYPVTDAHKKVVGILTLGMSMSSFSESVKWPSLPPGSVVSVQDSEGVFIARSIEREQWIGKKAGHAEWAENEVSYGVGPDRIRRLYAHAKTSQGWHVRAGIPPEEMLGNFRLNLMLSIWASVAGLSIAFILAWSFGRKVAVPISQLKAAVDEVVEGNLTVKVIETGPAELTEVATQFNAMVTALAEAQEDVARHVQKLQESNQELESFSYSISHDLRTPLRAVDGFSLKLLKNYGDKLDDEGLRLLHVVRDNTARMGQLIDDILAFSRAGRFEVNRTEVDMNELLHSIWQDLQPQVADREIELVARPLPKVQGDRTLLHQVLENLLSNAIKFTRAAPSARIEVGCDSSPEEHVFYIKDNGAGFDPAYAHKLFGVFQRLHGVDEFEGTGIGLAIVKRIVTRHGGRVMAEGNVNQGATIRFALPSEEKKNA